MYINIYLNESTKIQRKSSIIWKIEYFLEFSSIIHKSVKPFPTLEKILNQIILEIRRGGNPIVRRRDSSPPTRLLRSPCNLFISTVAKPRWLPEKIGYQNEIDFRRLRCVSRSIEHRLSTQRANKGKGGGGGGKTEEKVRKEHRFSGKKEDWRRRRRRRRHTQVEDRVEEGRHNLFDTFLNARWGHERCIEQRGQYGVAVHTWQPAAAGQFGPRQYHPGRPTFDRRGARRSPHKSLEIIAADARLIVGCITGSRDRASASFNLHARN